MIHNFTCNNFRNVKAERLPFKRINVIIGPNNSGKTNFLKALSFCPDMLNQDNSGSAGSAFLNEVSRNGWNKMYSRAGSNLNKIKLVWELSLNNRDLQYTFEFHTGEQQADFYITSEKLQNSTPAANYDRPFNFFDCHTDLLGKGIISTANRTGASNARKNFDVLNTDTVMTQFQKILLKNGELYSTPGFRVDGMSIVEEISSYFKKFVNYSSSRFDSNAIRKASDSFIRGDVLFDDGSNFVNVLNQRFSSNAYLKDEMLSKIQKLIPNADAINIAPINNMFTFQLGIDHNLFDMTELSEGTIKALLLIMILFVPDIRYEKNNLPEFSLLTIDEPENNLHPAWQKWVGRWIQNSSNFEQCFICTHSPDFLDSFTEGFKNGDVAVYAFDPKKENLINPCNYEVMKSDLEDWELGDLYRTNDPALGGWPW